MLSITGEPLKKKNKKKPPTRIFGLTRVPLSGDIEANWVIQKAKQGKTKEEKKEVRH